MGFLNSGNVQIWGLIMMWRCVTAPQGRVYGGKLEVIVCHSDCGQEHKDNYAIGLVSRVIKADYSSPILLIQFINMSQGNGRDIALAVCWVYFLKHTFDASSYPQKSINNCSMFRLLTVVITWIATSPQESANDRNRGSEPGLTMIAWGSLNNYNTSIQWGFC